MKMQACKSSQVKEHGYDPLTRTMAITFNSGATYHYHDVPQDKYDELCKAESVGKHIHSHVKGAYKFKKLGD